MHDGVNWDNDLQREVEFRKHQHHLMIDGEPSITAFAVANRPTSVHRLGDTVRDLQAAGKTTREIRDELGISAASVCRLLRPLA
jgi:hypothetical protein